MPQTDDAKDALNLLDKGLVNVKEPFSQRESKVQSFSEFLNEKKR
jgi:hypothetical protein